VALFIQRLRKVFIKSSSPHGIPLLHVIISVTYSRHSILCIFIYYVDRKNDHIRIKLVSLQGLHLVLFSFFLYHDILVQSFFRLKNRLISIIDSIWHVIKVNSLLSIECFTYAGVGNRAFNHMFK